jgi:(R,R)-butanediol dehydrogenase/meso-butanediol dehydrogenase/diacetyl reductase
VESCVDAGALGVGPLEAALAQPMAIAVHAMRRSRVREGDVAIVQGVGGVGAFLIHALVHAGARVVAVDLDASRLEVARSLGADVVITAGTESSQDEIASEIGERIPVFFEVTGSQPGLRLALDVVPMGTSIVLVGIQKGLSEVDLARVTVREIELIGTNAMVRETDFPDAVRLVSLRTGGWGDVVSSTLSLDELVEGALRPMAEGRPPAIKTLIAPYSTRH